MTAIATTMGVLVTSWFILIQRFDRWRAMAPTIELSARRHGQHTLAELWVTNNRSETIRVHEVKARPPVRLYAALQTGYSGWWEPSPVAVAVLEAGFMIHPSKEANWQFFLSWPDSRQRPVPIRISTSCASLPERRKWLTALITHPSR